MKSKTRYWLFKSEPNAYSIADLKLDKTTFWDGIRNYQARNLMRDQMQVEDKALFYHSSCKDVGVVGEMEVLKTVKFDPTQFDSNSKYFDAKSTAESPRWVAVTLKYVATFNKIVTLGQLRQEPSLRNLIILRKGNRLSITEVTKGEYETIKNLSQ